MAGYIQDPLQIINLIADNLRDRYKSGFPVLKEIIQNTDDAGEADEKLHLEFGLSSGISEAEHPLLKGPALYFINNGNFKDSDNKAIRSFGLNSKAIEQSSIGKFGLGMKSVFHFCEAFFFLAKNKEKEFFEILNPWSGDEQFSTLHKDWNDFSIQDAIFIKEQSRTIMEMMDLSRSSYFLLWLPLRKDEHLKVNGHKLGSIISEFPGDDPHLLSFLFEPDLAQRLAAILPLLRRVTHIRFWNQDKQPVFTVDLDKRSKRIIVGHIAHNELDLVGAAIYSHPKEKIKDSIVYVGKEVLIDNPELTTLRDSPLWPKSYIRDELGMSQIAPDKAQGHSAVVFSRSSEKANGKLIINWAVFLPVSQERSETIRCSGNTVFRLTLHGYFFVDAGRADIEGIETEVFLADNGMEEPANEADLRRKWNTCIAQEGTLPLILPALEAFVIKTKFSADSTWHLSEGLKDSKLFHRHRKSICAKCFWACCLTRLGREWRVLPREHEILPLPGPPLSAPERPWETLPKLTSFQERGVILLLNDAPHLLLQPLPQWHEDNLLEVLHLKEKEVFVDQGRLDYLLQFLADPAIRPFLKISSLQERLQQIARRALTALGTTLRQQRKKVQEFLSFLLPDCRYPLDQDNAQIIRELQLCEIGVLILAKEFDPHDNNGTARLALEDAVTLLQKLHDLIIRYEQRNEQEMTKHCRAIAREILQGQDEEQRRALLSRANDLKILEGYDCLLESLVALSPAELKKSHGSRLLYLYSQGVNDVQRRGLASKLQRAIHETVLLVNSRTAEFVFGRNNELAPCHADSVLDSLGAESLPLQTIDNRLRLLSDVAGADLNSPRRVRGLRYLLHGFDEHFDDGKTLWVSGHEQSPVWGKLWQQLEGQKEDGWNLLERELVAEIPSNKWSKLSIREIKPEGILDELRDKGTAGITGEQFSEDDRNAVLRELASDEELWKTLPFHETVKGDLVRITIGKSYLETDITLPNELLSCADIIKRSKDQAIKRQQKDWLTSLSEKGVIQIVLQHEQPAKFWRLVMDNLEPAGNLILSPVLRDTPWLPDINLAPVKPMDVVYLENMQDEVDRLLAIARGAFWSPGKLHADLQQHPSFPLLKKNCFATGEEGLEKLALLLGETDEYHIGRVVFPDNEFEAIVRTCARIPVSLCLPGWTLLSSVMGTYSNQMAKEYLLPEAVKPISAQRIIAVLNWLKEEHVKVGQCTKKDFLAAFNTYLAALVNEEYGLDFISQLSLLNCDGDWKPTKDLCSEAEGVADSHLLDGGQKRILRSIIFHADHQYVAEDDKLPRKGNLQSEISASADILAAFFAEWEGLVAPEIICAFLSLLGDDPEMLALAEQYRGRHSVEYIRHKFPWQVHHRTDELNRREWLYGLDQPQALAQHRFIVQCSDGDRVKTFSILGDEIEVPLKSRFSTLIIGGLFYEESTEEITNVRLTLRSASVDSPLELSELLRASSEYLLKNAYNQRDYGLGGLWEELDKSEQFGICIAQQLVLDHIPFYLRQLGVHKNPQLQDLLNQWNEARHKQEEYYESKEKRDVFDLQKREILSKIQELLKTDKKVQDVVLHAVRAKMKDFQYSVASIPFELFQNADDAVVELAMMKAYPNVPEEISADILPEYVRRFLVIEQDDSLTIAHWGRPVNDVGIAGFPGKEKGFHYDLEKMLVLSSSDKSEDGMVTGKFGLGFKSILLACERPQLISGRLATEIIAGLCPIPLKDSARLYSKLQELSLDRNRKWKGTLLELPLTDIATREIMASFGQVAGIMTIFSKQIRRIDINGDTNRAWEWKPVKIPLSDDAWLESGELPLPAGLYQRGLAVYFKLPGGGILVALGPEGFRVLPAELPAIWVVAPTKEREGLGFAINCMFDLDAGRARLAGNSPTNKQKANDLGRALGQALRKLYVLSQEQWEALKSSLRLEEDLPVYDFWATFWKVMGEGLQVRGSDEVSTLVAELLFGDNGLGYLVSHEDALPNGLWGDSQSLTRPEKIRIVIKGSLGKESIFRELVKWEFFRNFLGTPESVTSEEVFTVVRRVFPAIGQTRNQWRSVQFSDVLQNLAETEKKISPTTAGTLGRLLNHNTLKNEDFEKEREPIEKALHAFSFKTQDGSFHSANEILVLPKHHQANPDETKQAAFAPDENILSMEYQGNGLDFFFACREKRSIRPDKMVQWLIDAPTETQRGHALRYLLDGEYGEKVADSLIIRGLEGTWLAGLQPNSPCFHDWPEHDIFKVLFKRLSTVEDLHRLHTETPEIPYDLPGEELKRHDPKEILQRIYVWWMDSKDELVIDYERRTYPENLRLNLAENEVGRIDRKSWLVLFTLAHFHTMGRQRDIQHKGFIDKCIEKTWWDTFSEEQPELRPDAWMGVLEQYIDDQVELSEYENWMNRFPAIYKFSRWLEDYKEAFLSIERKQSISDISGILKTRVNADYQGGGISAPPIEKSLGYGACFALRELKRKQILNGSQIVPYCYVPVKRTLELCGYLGCQDLSDSGGINNSKTIYGFLCRNLSEAHAEFSNCYDIPLQILAEREDVFRMILS